jgi:pyruvate kinase
MGKVVIVSHNMLESMTVYPSPIRAKVSDIALFGKVLIDAIMFSGETAHGQYVFLFSVLIV